MMAALQCKIEWRDVCVKSIDVGASIEKELDALMMTALRCMVKG